MKALSLALLATALALPASAAPRLRFEAGAGYFFFRHARLADQPTAFAIDEPGRLAPFVAVSHDFTERFGLRWSYQHVDDAQTTTEFRWQVVPVDPQINVVPPSTAIPGPVLLFAPPRVFGHYRDDIHILGLAPEFTWEFGRRLSVVLAPELNWVASRGTVSYSSDSAFVLLVAPRGRREDGFMLGGGAKARWALNERTALSLGYRYLDLEPSFDREAHVISAGVEWRF